LVQNFNVDRRSGHDRTPLGHGGGAPSFVDFATDEMTFVIEMVADRGVN
jgi:hypothetical protein